MRKRIFALVLALWLCLAMPLGVFADTETQAADVEEETVEQTEESGFERYFQVYILAGAVIGAMVVVTVLYKKKDEIRYL